MGRRLKTTIKFVPLICFSLAGLFAAFFSYVDYNHNYTYSYAENSYAIVEFFRAFFEREYFICNTGIPVCCWSGFFD